MKHSEVKAFLDLQLRKHHTSDFIASDPVSIPHRFSATEDIEVSGFLTATISWGQRTTILKNAEGLMMMMDYAPFDFVSHASALELRRLDTFVHRTFNGTDAKAFVRSLRKVYGEHGGPQALFSGGLNAHGNNMGHAIRHFRDVFLKEAKSPRTSKHVADPTSGSAAKRINMFLRWMVRKDSTGVDFGIWNSISPSVLMCPLDVHSGRVARALGLLSRKQDDWMAVEQLTASLRKFDPADPVKYDYALFGAGVSGIL
jgi:uncharacterized protein (TIGR02757 family)